MGASASQRTRPVLRSRAIVKSRFSPLAPLSRVATAVRYTRSPTTTGEECPGGNAVFQMTLALGPISPGNGASFAGNPEQLGPRNCAQSEPAATDAQLSTTAAM